MRTTDAPTRVFSYWTGPLTWMERLSAASAVATGHELTVFSYEPQALRLAGLGVAVEDGREILDKHGLDGMNRALPGHFSDHFRVEGLARRLGIWCDLDILFLQTLPQSDFVFGREVDDMISGAVLGLPTGSAILNDYLQMCRRRPLPVAAPWLPWHERAQLTLKHWRRRMRGHRGIRPPYGPPALTHLVEVHHLQNEVAERPVYHPLDPHEVAALAERADFTPDPRSRTIHMFGSHFRATMGTQTPPRSSWLGAQARAFGVS